MMTKTKTKLQGLWKKVTGALMGGALLLTASPVLAGEKTVTTANGDFWPAWIGIIIGLIFFVGLVAALAKIIKPDPAWQHRYWRDSRDNSVVPFDVDGDGRNP